MGRLRKKQIEEGEWGRRKPPKKPENKVCDPLGSYEQLKMPLKITYTQLRLKCHFRNTLWNRGAMPNITTEVTIRTAEMQ